MENHNPGSEVPIGPASGMVRVAAETKKRLKELKQKMVEKEIQLNSELESCTNNVPLVVKSKREQDNRIEEFWRTKVDELLSSSSSSTISSGHGRI